MSWKSRALELCDRWNITFEDHSDGEMYRGYFEAPEGCFLYETGTAAHTHVLKRFKGSDKSKFWYQVYNIASVGFLPDESHDEWLKEITEFDNQQEKE
jgi:hypothetical protein